MKIENLKIENFRNIKKTEIKPGSNINFIIGDNAQGKTNLVESIYSVALLKSFRTNNCKDLIKKGEFYSSISLYIKNGLVKNKINLKIENNIKKITINNKKPDKNRIYSYLNVVAYHPDEVNYITNYPLFRRNLIDRSIFYTNYSYINIYKNYFRCLKQRNNYLKGNKSDIDCWKSQLIKYGAEIIRSRINYINKINEIFKSDNFNITNDEQYFLSYSKEYKNIENIENILEEDFDRKKNREKILGYTLTGPHKDDIFFYLNNQSAEKYSSQGQKKSLVISYKTAQILDYKKIHNYYPVLILDDMTSELDSTRKNELLENLLNNSGQVFITSTNFKKNMFSKQNNIFNIKNGDISLSD